MGTKKLRKTLPKDLAALLEQAAQSGDDTAVHAALEPCEIDARGGYRKETVLMMSNCTPELARWLVGRGLDVNAVDLYGMTALHESARSRFHHRLTPAVLLELGADVNAASSSGLTPLHSAVDGKHLEAVEVLLTHGAAIDARSREDRSPLEYALERISNIDLVAMLPVARAMLAAGAQRTPRAQDFVRKAAANFEFHRAGFAADSVAETSDACAALCALFGVEPPAQRRVHDGQAPIVARAATWQLQHAELWDLLVPSSGACATAQGEVIRISGRISDELSRNGGANWDGDYDAMANALCAHIASHNPLEAREQAECKALVGRVRRDDEASGRLAELAVAWVARNPQPIALPPPGYRR